MVFEEYDTPEVKTVNSVATLGEVVLGAGGSITKPRGELHAMWNAGRTPARMIEIISPAGFEGFFRELAELNLSAAGPPAVETMASLAAGTVWSSATPHGCLRSSPTTD